MKLGRALVCSECGMAYRRSPSHAPFFSVVAACSELAILLLGSYCAGALFLNSYFGRPLLPLGKPFGFIRKGPLARPAKKMHLIEPIAAAAKR